MMTNDFLVCIQSLTYNHAPYIKDAMNGFCIQQTDFPFVAIIIDDASTDGEQDIIKEYLAQHFDMKCAEKWETDDAQFIYVQHNENRNCYFAAVLLKYNFYQKGKIKEPLIARWLDNSKYLALCEGDDYWIAPQKLQKQIDYLEKNAECGLVYSFAQINRNGTIGKGVIGKDYRKLKCMMSENPIPTVTTVFRTLIYCQYLKDIKPETRNWLMGDKPLWYYIQIHYNVSFLPEITSVYRLLDESASHSQDLNRMIAFRKSARDINLFFLDKYYKNSPKYQQEYRATQQIYYSMVILFYLQHGDNQGAAEMYHEGYKNLQWPMRFRYFVYINCPFLWTLRKKIG